MSAAKLCVFLDMTDWSVECSLIDDVSGSASSALFISDTFPIVRVPSLLSPLGLVICVSAFRVYLVREGLLLCGINSDSGVMS